MPDKDETDRAKRISKGRKEKLADAPQARADYYAAEQRIRDRTRHLREQRLAREARKGKGSG